MYKLEVLENPISVDDLNEIWDINQANIPEVSDIPDMGRLRDLITWCSHVIVVRADEVAGFILLMRENQNYDSLNYDFFNSKEDPFLYVDRIAIKKNHIRNGLGSMIYKKTLEIADNLGVMTCCEVNTEPRNDPSLAFHSSFGFKEVGLRDFDDHSVVYLVHKN